MQRAQQDLFENEQPAATEGDALIARRGLSHFRDQVARYAKVWPYLMPEWQAWIAYFERMLRYGFNAAQTINPRDAESEPSKMCAALTRRARPAERSGEPKPTARADMTEANNSALPLDFGSNGGLGVW